jgi:hypothetical protein
MENPTANLGEFQIFFKARGPGGCARHGRGPVCQIKSFAPSLLGWEIVVLPRSALKSLQVDCRGAIVEPRHSH